MSEHGTFSGRVVAVWDDSDDKIMILLEPFTFTEPDGTVWEAPVGAAVNGASIPRLFWRVVGNPYQGRYRRASVLHDVACDRGTETGLPSWRTHLMFWRAMRADGVGMIRAWLMWAAVRCFGPRW